MDKLTDFLEEVKIRLRNPLLASFIFSWFIWNWKIWIGLFWLDSKALERLNQKSYIEFVENELNMGNGFFNPLISAIIIVLLLPLIRNLIEMYQAWALNWGERRVTEISKTGVISIEKYIEKKNQLEKQHEEFKKMAANETELIARVSSIEGQLEDKTNQLEEKSNDYKKLQSEVRDSYNVDSILGTWDVRPGFNGNEVMRITITKREIYQVFLVDNTEKYGQILFCQNYEGRLTLCFKNGNMINFLTLNSNNKDYMTGRINDTDSIEWERKIKN